MQIYEGRVCPPPKGYIVVAVARFNKTITQRLLDGALAKLRQHQVHEDDIRVVWVPGAYELPFAATYFVRDEDCLGVICLGAVIKGETSHDEHINRAASMLIGDTACRFGKPVAFGVITCDTVEQADARSGIVESVKDKSRNPAPGNKGAEAAEAILEMIDLMTELPEIKSNIPTAIAKLLSGQQDDEFDDAEFDDDDDEFDEDEDDDFTGGEMSEAQEMVRLLEMLREKQHQGAAKRAVKKTAKKTKKRKSE
ncbi:hypothetical protein FACS189454_05530 [Planctomycetales bacterium]|nr:hypothetical protein FACS189454_05530 [Planctomycetales bacterium]